MTSLDKRIEYLGLADFDYLSARLLLVSGLANTGFPKAAEAFEKLLKLFLLLEAKITTNTVLTEKDMKKYGHNLINLFEAVKSKLSSTSFDNSWDSYFKTLQDSYTRRYPESWTEFKLAFSLDQLDKAYSYMRNGVTSNFPPEERPRARQFGTFIYDAYRGALTEKIRETGAPPPIEILKWRNSHLEDFDIDLTKL